MHACIRDSNFSFFPFPKTKQNPHLVFCSPFVFHVIFLKLVIIGILRVICWVFYSWYIAFNGMNLMLILLIKKKLNVDF